MTDNKNRTASTVRSTFSKSGGNLGETGSVSFMFDRKGLVIYRPEVGDAEIVFEAAILAGAEDVDSSEDGHEIFCESSELNEVSNILEENVKLGIDDGEIIAQNSWDDIGIMMKSRLWLMAFHQGKFGTWNFLLILITALALMLLSIAAIYSYLYP